MTKMTKEEMDKQLQILKNKYIAARTMIHARYATENNPYQVGDILEDKSSGERIKVEKMSFQVSFASGIPYATYTGTRLKKDNTAFKNDQKAILYQCNPLVKIN